MYIRNDIGLIFALLVARVPSVMSLNTDVSLSIIMIHLGSFWLYRVRIIFWTVL